MATKKISDLTLRSDFDETCLLPVDDATQSWRVTGAQIQSFLAPTAPTVQKFTSGSGTYTTPTGVLYIRVRAVGGGGGGQGSSNNGGGGAGGTGGNTTFGTALIVANGAAGQFGGSASLGTGPVGVAYKGSGGGANYRDNNANGVIGAPGGASSPFGGAGQGNQGSADTNSGSGGGGAHFNGPAGDCYGGASGGAGGYVDAIINNPSASYSYAVGAAGAGGTAGTNGAAGGAGGSGVIVVEEFYQ